MSHRVLIVEDEVVVLYSLMRGLEAIDSLSLEGFASAEDAVSSIEESVPDLLITDIRLPGQSGLELIAEIHRRDLSFPIIVTTAHKSSYSEMLSSFGELSVLEKPVSISTLRRTVLEKLGRGGRGEVGTPFRLAEYIQLVGMGGHSLMLRVSDPGGITGSIHVFKGEIWNATCGRHSGLNALRILLALESTTVLFDPISEPPPNRTVEGKWDALLIRLAREADEAARNGGTTAFIDPREAVTAGTEDVCRGMVENVEDCIAAGVVDLNTGVLMGGHVTDSMREYLDAVSTAAVEMYRGKKIRDIERVLADGREIGIKNNIEELFISSVQFFHFMMLIREKESVVVMVTKKSTNRRLGWASLRNHVRELSATLP